MQLVVEQWKYTEKYKLSYNAGVLEFHVCFWQANWLVSALCLSCLKHVSSEQPLYHQPLWVGNLWILAWQRTA